MRVSSIGDTLRATRLAHALTLEDVEYSTKIKAKFLAALEAERFELMPSDSYARAFLREYALALGIDPLPLLNEFDSRWHADEPLPIPVDPEPRRTLRRGRTLLVCLAAAAAALVWFVGWHSHQTPARAVDVQSKPRPHHAAVRVPPSPPPGKSTLRRSTTPPAGPPRTLVTARGGSSWLQVRDGSPGGTVLYEAVLRPDQTIRFARTRLWMRIGDPRNIVIEASGRRLAVPPQSAAISVLVTRSRLTRV